LAQLIAVNCATVVGEDTRALAFEILELATMQRPTEDAKDQQHQAGGKRDQ
jgi:hypothetical protein